MKSYDDMVDMVLSQYFAGKKTLELGFFSGNHTPRFAKHAGELTSIDVAQASYDLAKKNLSAAEGGMPGNLTLMVMDAAKMAFPDASFHAVVSTSFHEMGASQEAILAECDRVLGLDGADKTLIFSEPDIESITNELFKVFDPKENHAARIVLTKARIQKFASVNGYKILELEPSVSHSKFTTEEELLDEMLAWWSDVKVPADETEAAAMKTRIKEILTHKASRDFKKLSVNEVSWNWVLTKPGLK